MALFPISRFEYSRKTYPIVVPFSIALESLPKAEIILVHGFDGAGNCGLGEAAPFPSLTFDTPDSALACLNEVGRQLVGLEPKQALAKLKEQSEETRKLSVTAYCALESALLDLLAKQSRVSLHSLYGSAALGQVETDLTVPLMPSKNVAGFLSLFSSYGFRTIKVKVSGHVSDDLALVHEVYRAIPQGTVLTLDGNQGFEVSNAKKLLAALEKQSIRPAFFEQPLEEGNWAGVGELLKTTDTVVCLDEAVRSPKDLIRAISEAGPQVPRLMINLKIMKSGIGSTLELMDLATRAGIPMMMGGMLESEIAMTHSLHIACGKGGIEYFDLDTPFFFQEGPTVSHPWSQKSSQLTLPQGIGLGLGSVW